MMQQDRDLAEFNMAISYLNRLNYQFYMLADAKLRRDLATWMECLVILFTELTPEFKTTDKPEEKKKELKRLKGKVNEYIVDRNAAIVSGKIPPGIEPDLYWQLIEFEGFLREIMKESGFQMRYQDDPKKALR